MAAPIRPSPPRAAGLRPWRRLRRPSAFWSATLALAALTALVVGRGVGAAAEHAARYGDETPALVATRALAPGDTLDPGSAELRPVPRELVPDGALSSAPSGQVVRAPIHEGEVVAASRVGDAGLSPTAALLPPGTRGVAVPLGTGALPLRPGDQVDVLATLDSPAGVGPAARTVARSAAVVAVDEDAVTVAVTPEEAASVAHALHTGVITLLLAGPGP